MLFYNHINLGHQPYGFGEGDDDLLVVGDIVRREFPSFAVLEPFFADLVAADVEVPHVLWNTTEALGLCLVNPDGLIGINDFFDLAAGH